jgi:hypothetical protein
MKGSERISLETLEEVVRVCSEARQCPWRFPIYAIYDSPEDFRGRVVVRKWTVCPNLLGPGEPGGYPSCSRGTEPWAVCDTIGQARHSLPDDVSIRIAPAAPDARSIKEIWR